MLEKEQQEKAAQKTKAAQEKELTKKENQTKKRENGALTKQQKKEKRDKETQLKLAARFTAGRYEQQFAAIRVNPDETK